MTERREKMRPTEAQKKQVDEVREWLAKYIFHEIHPITDVFPDYWGITDTMDDESWRRVERHCFHRADQILSHPRLAILDKDQSIPEIKHESYPTVGTQIARDHFEAGWNNGVNKAYRLGFRRIIPPEGTDANR